jgi:hypothetical protein
LQLLLLAHSCHSPGSSCRGSLRPSGAAIDLEQFAPLTSVKVICMRILDVTCASCTSVYQVAESVSVKGSPGRAECTVCGNVLESWREPRLRAYRLVMPLKDKYKPVAAPPSPAKTPSRLIVA